MSGIEQKKTLGCEIEQILGYKFKNSELLERALTHRSYLSKDNTTSDNERIEFLGDSVVSLVVCDYLFDKFQRIQEDELSKLKSAIVSQKNLASWGEKIGLGDFIKMSDAERSMGGARKSSIIAGCFEAIAGAIFLDGGFSEAKRFVVRFLEETNFNELEPDTKSILQEIFQRKFNTLPMYRVVKEEGPAHDKTFEVEVVYNDKVYGRGRGSSKKEAQKNAAEDAIKNLRFQI